mmetsp:Transcript_33212/g.91908  ORF Transcript_33212/g.91908 Transcript_33212/m.91908 type:complete len:270 (+) Transcript_33212:1518-2327(+)
MSLPCARVRSVSDCSTTCSRSCKAVWRACAALRPSSSLRRRSWASLRAFKSRACLSAISSNDASSLSRRSNAELCGPPSAAMPWQMPKCFSKLSMRSSAEACSACTAPGLPCRPAPARRSAESPASCSKNATRSTSPGGEGGAPAFLLGCRPKVSNTLCSSSRTMSCCEAKASTSRRRELRSRAKEPLCSFISRTWRRCSSASFWSSFTTCCSHTACRFMLSGLALICLKLTASLGGATPATRHCGTCSCAWVAATSNIAAAWCAVEAA